MIRHPLFVRANFTPEAWEQLNTEIDRFKQQMAMQPLIPGPYSISIEFSGAMDRKYFVGVLQPELLSGVMNFEKCRLSDPVHKAAQWSYLSYEWRVDPQWGNRFGGAITNRKIREAREREDWDTVDCLETHMMGW